MSHFNSDDFSGTQVGGGYMNNNMQTPSKSNNFSNPGQSPSKFTSNEQCLLPLMIDQIKNAEDPKPDEPFLIDGIEVTQATVVGKITKVDVQSVNTTITIEDGTGELDIKIWDTSGENSKSTPDQELLQENTLIRVVGKIKIFRGNRNIHSYRILKVESEDEVKLHSLECKYAHLVNCGNSNKMSNNSGMSNNNNNNMNPTTNNVSNSFGSNNNFGNSTGFGGSSSLSMGMDIDSEMSPVQLAVYKCVASSPNVKSDSGVGFDEIMNTLKNTDINDVRDAMEYLVNEGKLYSTIDDEHFKPTDDG